MNGRGRLLARRLGGPVDRQHLRIMSASRSRWGPGWSGHDRADLGQSLGSSDLVGVLPSGTTAPMMPGRAALKLTGRLLRSPGSAGSNPQR